MQLLTATDPGSPDTANEDWAYSTPDLIVVLDGATARLDSGCTHGVAWYTQHLGAAIVEAAADPALNLAGVLAAAIREVRSLHPACDLTHRGPSAAASILRFADGQVDWLVLGDVTLILDGADGVRVVTDNRVSATAADERAVADLYPIGSSEKDVALLAMKHAELDARNQPDGYWIAAEDPCVVEHALMGSQRVDQLRRFAVLSDGAARAMTMFRIVGAYTALHMLERFGPEGLIERVRWFESGDHTAETWPRNKTHDDATAVFGCLVPSKSYANDMFAWA